MKKVHLCRNIGTSFFYCSLCEEEANLPYKVSIILLNQLLIDCLALLGLFFSCHLLCKSIIHPDF